jgi:hypothetical protein
VGFVVDRVAVSLANSHRTKHSVSALDHEGLEYQEIRSHATLRIECKTSHVAEDRPWAESIGEPRHSKKDSYSKDEEARRDLSGWITTLTIDTERAVAIATRAEQKTVDVRNFLALYLRF